MYDRHYNRHAAELWWKHREILRAISRRFPTSLSRRQAVIREHHALIDALKRQDADGGGAHRRRARRGLGAAHHRADGRGQAPGRSRRPNAASDEGHRGIATSRDEMLK